MDDNFEPDLDYGDEPLPYDELEAAEECPSCGGSGGGPEHWRCSGCGGKGTV